eukprot:6214386-Pleurochrysis_carterae.AAC.1
MHASRCIPLRAPSRPDTARAFCSHRLVSMRKAIGMILPVARSSAFRSFSLQQGKRYRYLVANALHSVRLRAPTWLQPVLGGLPDIHKLAGACRRRFRASRSIPNDFNLHA